MFKQIITGTIMACFLAWGVSVFVNPKIQALAAALANISNF